MLHGFSVLAGNHFPQESVGIARCACAANGHAGAGTGSVRRWLRCVRCMSSLLADFVAEMI
jgi:hypothetical protein